MPLQPLIVPFGTLLKPEYRKNLVGHWKMNVGGLIIPDLSGNGNHGTRTNYNWNATSGWQGQGDIFDGSDDYVNTNYILPTTDFTLGFWWKPNSEQPGRPFGAFGSSGLDVLPLRNWPSAGINTVDWVVRGGSSFDFGAVTYLAGNWQFVVFTMSSVGGTNVYANGQLVQTKSSQTSMGIPSAFKIGSGSANYFNGLIDDVRIYNRALSAGEVAHSCFQQEDGWDLGLDDDIDVTQGVPIELLQSGNLM
jgi:hypothetical protein